MRMRGFIRIYWMWRAARWRRSALRWIAAEEEVDRRVLALLRRRALCRARAEYAERLARNAEFNAGVQK